MEFAAIYSRYEPLTMAAENVLGRDAAHKSIIFTCNFSIGGIAFSVYSMHVSMYCLLFIQCFMQASDKAGYLVRQYIHYSLYDRIRYCMYNICAYVHLQIKACLHWHFNVHSICIQSALISFQFHLHYTHDIIELYVHSVQCTCGGG